MNVLLSEICVSTTTVEPKRKPDHSFRYIDISSVDNVAKKIIAARELPGAEAPSRARNLIKSGDIILSTTRPNLNAVAMVSDEYDETVCSTGFCVLRPSPKIDSKYLFFYLRSGVFINSLTELVKGALYPAVSDRQVFQQVVPLKDLPTQRRIASRLKQQMAAIDQMRQAVKDQEDAVTPLFERTLADAFQGITPLSLGIGADAAPAGWQWRRLLDLARLESGHTPSRRHPEYWENGDIPWLALPDIRALDCLVAQDTSEHTNKLGIANSSARILPKDTVALSRTASVGFVTRFGRPMATSQDFVNWICGTELDPAFLMWLLRASRKFIRSVSTGAIHQTVYVDVVNRFEVCLPDLATQRAIAARMDECFTNVENLRRTLAEQSEAISALPGAYLAEAFGSAVD